MTTLNKLNAHLATPVNELTKGYSHKPLAEHLQCADGTTLSVQASETHYCTPRDNFGPYTEVEVWCVTGAGPDGVTEFDYSDGDPSGYVPIEQVALLIDNHGGFAK